MKASGRNGAAAATFTMVATIQSGADAITKRDRGTLVFVKHFRSCILPVISSYIFRADSAPLAVDK